MANIQKIDADSSLNNADSYARFAKAVHLRCSVQAMLAPGTGGTSVLDPRPGSSKPKPDPELGPSNPGPSPFDQFGKPSLLLGLRVATPSLGPLISLAIPSFFLGRFPLISLAIPSLALSLVPAIPGLFLLMSPAILSLVPSLVLVNLCLFHLMSLAILLSLPYSLLSEKSL